MGKNNETQDFKSERFSTANRVPSLSGLHKILALLWTVQIDSQKANGFVIGQTGMSGASRIFCYRDI